MAGDIASARAAADRLPSAAAWLNTCIPVRRSSIRFLTLDKSLSPFRPYSTPVAGDHIPGMTNSSTSRASDHAMTGSHTDPAVPTMPVLFVPHGAGPCFFMDWQPPGTWDGMARSEEHTSELQSLMRISYAVLCLKKKRTTNTRDPFIPYQRRHPRKRACTPKGNRKDSTAPPSSADSLVRNGTRIDNTLMTEPTTLIDCRARH